MIARVVQNTVQGNRVFGAPKHLDGEDIPIREFVSGIKVQLGRLVLPTIVGGEIGIVGMILETIPVFNESGAKLIRKQLLNSIQLLPCITDDGIPVWLGNTLHVVDCLDAESSKAEFYPANYPLSHLSNCVKTAFCLSCFETAIAGLMVFRAERDPLKLIGTDEFFSMFEDCGICRGALPRYVVV